MRWVEWLIYPPIWFFWKLFEIYPLLFSEKAYIGLLIICLSLLALGYPLIFWGAIEKAAINLRTKMKAELKFKGGYVRKLKAYTVIVFSYRLTFHVLLLLSNLFVGLFGERFLLKCDTKKYGIVIAAFAGPSLQEQFGDFGVREKIRHDFVALADPSLDIQIRMSNRVITNDADARNWKQVQRAKMLLWGYSEVSEDSVVLHVLYEGTPVIRVAHQNIPGDTINFGFSNRHQRFSWSNNSPRTMEHLANHIEAYALTGLAVAACSERQANVALGMVEKLKLRVDSGRLEERLLINMIEQVCYRDIENWHRLKEASLTADTIMKHFPDFPPEFFAESKYNYGMACLNLEDTSNAIEFFWQALEAYPSNVDPCAQLCRLYLKLGDFDNVIRITNSFPGFTELHAHMSFSRGMAWSAKGVRDSAEICYHRAIELDSSLDTIYRKIEKIQMYSP
jgi:hypothetical protein